MSLDTRSPYPQDLRHGGVAASARAFVDRVRTGDLGALPVVTGLVLIGAVFQVLNPNFLSSANLVNLTMQSAAIGTMSIGIVLVLLVGGIDLSVGSVSGLAGAVLAVTFVQFGWPLPLAIVLALGAGAVAGLCYGVLYTRFNVPAFVLTLAGLLTFLGVQLWVLGRVGSINLPYGSWIVDFGQQLFLPPWASYVGAVVAAAAYAWTRLRLSRRRAKANLASQGYAEIAIRATALRGIRDLGDRRLMRG